MSQPVANHQTPCCPRCGYDQRGIVATWERTGACSLTGVCSECGLGFAWADLLSPERKLPRWSFEHGRGASLSRLGRTLLLSLVPWALWRRLRMEHRINLRRAVVVLLVGAVLGHFALGAVAGVRTYFVLTAGWWGRRSVPLDVALVQFLWPHGRPSRAPGNLVTDEFTVTLLCWAALVPLGFVCLRVTLGRAKVRGVHLARIWLYSFCGWLLLTVLAAVAAWLADAAVVVRQSSWWGPSSSLERFVAHFASGGGRAAATAGWLVVFWGFAVRRYLRLPHAWGVAVAMIVIAGLLAASASLLLMWGRVGGWLT